MNYLINTLNQFEPLSSEDNILLQKLQPIIKHLRLKKGQHLFMAGDIPDFEAFVNIGVLRHYIEDSSGNEKILDFYQEGNFIYDCTSYSHKKPIEYSVQALEDCDLSIIKILDIELFYTNFPSFEKIAIKMMQLKLHSHKEHLTILMKFSPEDKYKYVLENLPKLVQRISVTHLSQFLGLSRETLSRKRAKVFESNIL